MGKIFHALELARMAAHIELRYKFMLSPKTSIPPPYSVKSQKRSKSGFGFQRVRIFEAEEKWGDTNFYGWGWKCARIYGRAITSMQMAVHEA